MYATPRPRQGDALVERAGGLVGNGHETLLVQALYPYSYEMQPGREVSFEAGECFILVEKSNEDWWHVRKGEQDIYVPANYMSESCIDFADGETSTDTLSPSSEEGSYQDETKVETGEGTTSFHGDDSDRIYMNVSDFSERIYANIPVSKPQPSMRRHHSTGEERTKDMKSTEYSRPKSAILPSGWSIEVDRESGRTFYFNNETNESTWQPPPDSKYDDIARNSLSLPRGWRLERQSAVEDYLYVNDSCNEKWQSSQDQEGRTYYYNTNGETVWELPTFNEEVIDKPTDKATTQQGRRKLTPRSRMLSEGSDMNIVNLRHKSPHSHLRNSRSTSMLAGLSLVTTTSATEMSSFAKGLQRSTSDLARNSLVLSDEFPPPPNLPAALDYTIKKEGIVNRKKLCEKGGKKVKKAWGSCYLKLSSANMIMYKNQSAAQPKPGFDHGQPDSSCDLRGAVIQKMADENKRRNIMQIATVAKSCFLLQVDDVYEFSQWYHMIAEVIDYLKENEPVDNGAKAMLYGEIVNVSKPPDQPVQSGVSRGSLKKARGDGNKNIKDKLIKLITRRPPIEELKKKGIIKDTTFGCHIVKLCEKEQTKVPKVVVGCIEAIEDKGLDFDGLYRVSGNVSLMQQLRITVNQEETVKFGERPFDDVHVLSGALKLYFRELPEPLIPFDSYDAFVNSIKSSTKQAKTDGLRACVNKLPTPNSETFRFLFRHLKRVMENSSKNRMHAHNIAIVFGPTLLAPREEQHGNIAVNTVYQNQIVEFILLEYDKVLGKDS